MKNKDLSEAPVYVLINLISKGQSRFIEKNIQQFDITPSELPILMFIFKKRVVSQKDIADWFFVSEANVARSLKKLEEKNLLKRETDENNRRRRLISLTSEGLSVCEHSRDILDDWTDLISKNNTCSDMYKFKEILLDLANESLKI